MWQFGGPDKKANEGYLELGLGSCFSQQTIVTSNREAVALIRVWPSIRKFVPGTRKLMPALFSYER